MDKIPSIRIADSPFVWKNTASTPDVGSIKKTAAYPPAYPSPKIQLGSAIR